MCKPDATISAILLLIFYWTASLCGDETAFFHESIAPLLQDHCYDCHSHDSGEASGGLVLDSKAGWSAGGDSGPAVVPGSLDKSLLWQVVNYQESGLEMPPDGKLTDSDLKLIKQWIESGAVDPREDGRAAERKSIDIEAGRRWWSFRPLRGRSVSAATDSTDSEALVGGHQVTTIDALIQRKLLDAGLAPAPRADPATLIRRLSFDLTGLPPAREVVENLAA